MNSLPQDQNGRADLDRAAINRQNAQLSTGPNTEVGKQRSSLNALRHGLTGHVIVLPSEDLAAYQKFSHGFVHDFQPKGTLEQQLVQTLADTSWMMNRATAHENNLLSLGFNNQADKIDTDNPQVHAALAMALSLQAQTKALANISLHRDRLSRQFDRTLKQLREAQAERRQQETEALNDAAVLLKMHKDKKLPYNPADDGFVFTNSEIETHLTRDQRLGDARRHQFTAAGGRH